MESKEKVDKTKNLTQSQPIPQQFHCHRKYAHRESMALELINEDKGMVTLKNLREKLKILVIFTALKFIIFY